MDVHPVWHLLQQHIISNWEAYMALVSALCIAAVCTMPPKFPRSLDDWWDWLRNTSQTAVPAARANHQPANPIQPQPNQQEKI